MTAWREHITPRAYRAGDEEAILEGFLAVAGEVAHFPMTPADLETWRWKYLENPAGTSILLACEPSGRPIAHYAALPSRLWALGAERRAALVVDSWTLPEARSGEPSWFVRLGEAWAERHGGEGADDVALAYGVPSPGTWRIGRARLGYEMLRDANLLVHEGVPRGRPAAPGTIVVEEWDRIEHDLSELWARFVGTIGFGTIRDAVYLNWRYAERPGRPYRIWAARGREDGAVRGLAVTATGRLGEHEGCVLVDWFLPSWDHEAGDALVARFHDAARESGAERCLTLLPSPYEWHLRLQRWGYRVHPTDDFVAARLFVPGWDLPMLRNTWLYTAGDLWLM